jgi:hypothetical protein
VRPHGWMALSGPFPIMVAFTPKRSFATPGVLRAGSHD